MSERTWAQRKADNNDGMDPDWRPTFDPPKPQLFVPQEDYELIKQNAKGLEALLTSSKNEIRDRWDPLVKKLRKESAQFQQDMMDRHEMYVAAATRCKDMKSELKDAKEVMTAALHKLNLYREQHTGEYVGGLEFSQLAARLKKEIER